MFDVNLQEKRSELTVPDDEQFRVAIFARPDDPDELNRGIAEVLALNKIDARINGHHVPGLLPRSL